MADHYQILGVDKDAPADAIKKAYLKLARERHPDRFTDPAERERADQFFKDLTAAFNTLSNPSTRREYDESLVQPRRTAPDEIAAEAYARGLEAYQQKNFHDAVDLFRAAVHHVPGKAEYHLALGRALARNPKWVRDAIAELEKAVQLSPRQAEFHAELAGLYLSQGLKLRARRAAEAGLRVAPQDPRLLKVVQQSE
jgi:curved DNA-binding protein CbpA